jgi:hypothetical protein
VFCADTGGCIDSIEVVKCPNWGELQQEDRCSALQTQTLQSCSKTYNNVPTITSCQITDVHLGGSNESSRAACAGELPSITPKQASSPAARPSAGAKR